MAQAALGTLSNPAALQRIWQATLSTVKKEKQAYGVLFMGAKARFDAGANTVKIVFPAESAFAFNAVQKPDVREAVEAALRKAAGFDVPYTYEQAGAAAAYEARSDAKPQAQTQSSYQAQPNPKPQVEPKPEPQRQQPAYDDAPYEQVPYEDLPYEPVPYEEFDARPEPKQPASSAKTAKTPATAVSADDAAQDDPADIEAMLQAGFGGNVVFSEID